MGDATVVVYGIEVLSPSVMSLVLGTYIAILGCVVFAFARRNLAGDRARRGFLGWMLFTIVSVEGLVFTGNFGLFLGFWFATSAGVHHLLLHFRHREGARLVAWEKFLVSRIGDAALVAAAVLLATTSGSLNFSQAAATGQGDASRILALLVVLGALTKSAQVPFHSWLPRTLEAPTAVSSLLHAGIINAGGILLLRFGFVLQNDGLALAALVGVGGVTAVWGGFTMLVQADIKRRLAWSTVGQMGFMMVEIGLGAPSLALVHLMGHGLYKARAFLWSGEAKTGFSPDAGLSDRPAAAWGGLMLWMATGLLVGGVVAWEGGHSLVLLGVVWAALTPLAVGGWTRPGRGLASWVAATVVMSASVFVAAAAAWLVGLPEQPSHSLRDAVGMAVALGLTVAGLISSFSPWLAERAWYRRLYAGALHGFGWGRWPEVLAHRLIRPSLSSGGHS